MALTITRQFSDTILCIDGTEDGLYQVNHIFEPEFHQEKYVQACESIKRLDGSFQLGKTENLQRSIGRGIQPVYEDDENDPESLTYEGML